MVMSALFRPSVLARSMSLVLLVAMFAAVGCKQERVGRIGTAETTPDEIADARVLPVTLQEFAEDATQQLVRDLAEYDMIQDVDGRATILLGDIDNRTQIVSSNEFEIVQRNIRSTLLNSRIARDKLRFVERRGRMADLAAREGVQYDQPLERQQAGQTFALNGTFLRTHRHNTNSYYMEFTLTHFGTGEVIASFPSEVKQIRAR